MFNNISGKIQKVLSTNDCVKFCLGSLQRKFYKADSTGKITLHNFDQGQLMKEVNDLSSDYKEIFAFHNNVNLRYRTAEARPEEDPVLHMLFVQEIEKLIAITKAGVIKIFSENNSEVSTLERVFLFLKSFL